MTSVTNRSERSPASLDGVHAGLWRPGEGPAEVNDTTRTRRLPPEYGVETKKMPRIDLAALLVATGAHAPFVGFIPRELMDRHKATRRGFPRYEPPTFARLFAAARFRYPGLFARLRPFVLVEALVCTTPNDGAVHDEPPDERHVFGDLARSRLSRLARAHAFGAACRACGAR